MKEYKKKIYGLDCPNCALKLENALNKGEYLKDVTISFVSNTLTFHAKEENYDLAIEEINKIIAKVEEDAYLSDKENYEHNHHEHHHSCSCEHHDLHEHKVEKENKKINIILMSLSIILLVVGIILDNFTNLNVLTFIIFLISYVLVSYDILYKSIRNIFRGNVFDENFLMAIASIGALCLKEYHEAILVIFLYKLGEMFQDYALSSSHKSIKNLLELQVNEANLLKNNEVIKVDPKSINVDDVIIIKPGERVPLDGVIIEGNSSFDTSGISGESKPKYLIVDQEISSGYINLESLVKVKVIRTYENSNVSKMLKMIEESMDKKSNDEKFISKFAKYYTPIVVLFALLIVLVPLIVNLINPSINLGNFRDNLEKGLVFLVISCPCALVISIPLSFFSGIGRCSKSGILVKGSNYLEKMSNVSIVAFDKTGTITKGNFVINNIYEFNSSKEEVLLIAYLADYYSTHPIARAIKEKAKDIKIDLKQIEEVISLNGLGVKAVINSKVAYVGNEKLMKEMNIDYIVNKEVGSIVYVSYDSKFLGSIVIKDEIKEEAKESIASLHRQNIQTLMLSGDNKEIVKDIASKVGIINYKSELFPLDKVNQLEKAMNKKKKNSNVVFIGDGVNDAPSLIKADVGISMGSLGSDAAIESSDIVINDDSIEKVNELIVISKITKRIVVENIIFSIGIKVLVMILSLFGYANMLLGIFADVGVMILAVLNSMRILLIKKKV